MNLERWDITLLILSGPMARQQRVLRGPNVSLGSGPQSQLVFQGVRGVLPQHCVIQSYEGGQVVVTPIGTNPVRLAPHPQVRWETLQPLSGPAHLSQGCALHLGPPDRGVTVQFLGASGLGAWQDGSYSLQAQRIRPSLVPLWALGCFVLMMSVTAISVVIFGLGYAVFPRPYEPLGPEEDGEAYFRSVSQEEVVPEPMFAGLKQPFWDFVMKPNAEAAGSAQQRLHEPSRWDKRFRDQVSRSVQQHVRQRAFFKQLDAKRVEWATVLSAVREAGLPDVIAALPYRESLYEDDATSFACAKGYWQIMPEVALRVEQTGRDFRVRKCRMQGGAPYVPTDLTPPPVRRSPYVDYPNKRCLITGCAIDDRMNLRKSTEAALYLLGEAYRHPEVQQSGAAVQVTLLSHNAGFDDAAHGRKRKSNLLPALRTWIAENGLEAAPRFYGPQIACATHDAEGWCDSLLPAETQHYAYAVVAQHLLAVCYYGREYPDVAAFEPWSQYSEPGRYCELFDIPSKAVVRSW